MSHSAATLRGLTSGGPRAATSLTQFSQLLKKIVAAKKQTQMLRASFGSRHGHFFLIFQNNPNLSNRTDIKTKGEEAYEALKSVPSQRIENNMN